MRYSAKKHFFPQYAEALLLHAEALLLHAEALLLHAEALLLHAVALLLHAEAQPLIINKNIKEPLSMA